MPKKLPELSRRERQTIDVVYRLGSATAGDVQQEVGDAPSYSAVRAILATLVKKGHLRVEHVGTRYVYHPTLPPERARTHALTHVIDTFFGGSLAQAVSAMLDERSGRISKEEAKDLQQRLRQAREEGR